GDDLGGRVGWGKKPVVLVIDMCLGFTDPASPMACDADSVADGIKRVLDGARQAAVPVIYTTISWGAFESRVAARRFLKMPGGVAVKPGSGWTEIDPRIAPADGEPVLTKVFTSAFFDSPLSVLLRVEEVDTVIVTGVSTSGCVR